MDLGYTGAAIYLHVVIDHQSTQRFYIGQTSNLAARLQKYHMNFRHRRKEPSLHYYAIDHSIDDYYVTLAYIPDPEGHKHLGVSSPILFRNLLEMWCCLMFRTLSNIHLNEFLPPDINIRDRETEHLNLQVPLEHDRPYDWAKTRDALRDSPDPLRRKYYLDCLKRYYHKDPTVLEYERLIEEHCKGRDAPSTPRRTSSNSALLSPPPSNINQADQRPGLRYFNEVYAMTPSSTRSRAVTNSAMHSLGQNTSVDQLKTGPDATDWAKRKRQSFDETPSKPPRGTDAKRMCYSNSDSTEATNDDGIQQMFVSKLNFSKDLEGLSSQDFDYLGSSQEET